MTTQNLATPARETQKPRAVLENRAAEVIKMLLEGGTERAVAEAFGASRTGVTLFKARHADELNATREALADVVKTDWIADSAQRVAKLQALYELSESEVNEFGVTVVETSTDSDGDKETVTVTRDYRSGMVREMRGMLTDAATMLGQMPKTGANMGSGNLVLIREYHVHGGGEPLPLG